MRDYLPIPNSPAESDCDDEIAFKEFRFPQRRRRCFRFFSTVARKCRRIFRPFYVFITLLLFLFAQVTFNASYTSPPPFDIPSNETVYIAANIVNENLIRGEWGRSLVGLVDLIGKDRVFVSVYGGPKAALQELEDMLDCEYSIVSEEELPMDVDHLPHINLPTTGEAKIKRIAYLASARNQALAPLDTMDRRFDKLLFLNDVFFSPAEAARLLWGTNVINGKAEYRAVCATDFAASWKYYDTFATRDLEGYSLGLPIYPWFSGAGNAQSRSDVLSGKDAVRVKSCWGGMVAFDATYFQSASLSLGEVNQTRTQHEEEKVQLPLRFRSEPDPFYDSSECCLIHADLAALPRLLPSTNNGPSYQADDLGIYMNPYVRVTYDSQTRSYIGFAKRFERLFAIPQAIITKLVHLPVHNARRKEEAGDIIDDYTWYSNRTEATRGGSELEHKSPRRSKPTLEEWQSKGHWEEVQRVASRGGFCAVRQLLVHKEGPLEDGERNWENISGELPPPAQRFNHGR